MMATYRVLIGEGKGEYEGNYVAVAELPTGGCLVAVAPTRKEAYKKIRIGLDYYRHKVEDAGADYRANGEDEEFEAPQLGMYPNEGAAQQNN
jgi:hypothetical protein